MLVSTSIGTTRSKHFASGCDPRVVDARAMKKSRYIANPFMSLETKVDDSVYYLEEPGEPLYLVTKL